MRSRDKPHRLSTFEPLEQRLLLSSAPSLEPDPATAAPEPSAAVSGPGIEVSIDASRIAGVAPLAIFFDATATTGLVGDNHVAAHFEWNFDSTNVDPKDVREQATGFVAAHVFDVPGTYVVSLIVRDESGNAGVGQVTIDVQAQPIGGWQTYCVSQSGTDASCAPGATPIQTVADAQAALETNSRILFKRGESFDMVRWTINDLDGPAIIGAYTDPNDPTTQNPVLLASSVLESGIFQLRNSHDVRLMDIHVIGADMDSGVRSFEGSSNILVRGVEVEHIDGIAFEFGAPPDETDGFFLFDSFAHDFSDNGIFGTANRLAVVGNTINRIEALEDGGHAVRIASGQKTYISHNTITDNNAFTALTIRGKGRDTINTDVVVTDNVFDNVITFSPQNIVQKEFISNILAERNRFVPPPGADSFLDSIRINATNVMVRNNVFHNIRTPIKPFSHPTAAFANLITIAGNTHVIEETGNVEHSFVQGEIKDSQIKNNLMVSFSSATFSSFISANLIQTDVSNNIAYFPNSPAACVDVQGTTGTNCTDPQFLSTDPASADFLKLAPASPAIDTGAPGPLLEDYERRQRPQGAGFDLGAHEAGPGATNRAPVVGTIDHGSADSDPAIPGVQVAEGTPVHVTAVAADPDGDPFTWQWLLSADGGPEVPFAAGTNAPIGVRDAAFIYPYGTQSSVLLTLRVNDAGHVEQSTLILEKASANSSAQASEPITDQTQTTDDSAASPAPLDAVAESAIPPSPSEGTVASSEAPPAESDATVEVSDTPEPVNVAAAPDPQPQIANAAAAGQGIDVAIDASRLSGVAPLAVFFDATATSGLIDDDYVAAQFDWNFDSTNVDPNDFRERATGFLTAQVFDVPGTYVVSLIARDESGNAGVGQVTIDVAARPLGGWQTYCVSASGTDTSCAPGATPLQTIAEAQAALGPNSRVLLKRGESFDMVRWSISGVNGPAIIGAYTDPGDPSTENPVLQSSSILESGIIQIRNSHDVRVMDVHIVGVDKDSGVRSFNGSTNILVRGVEIEHIDGIAVEFGAPPDETDGFFLFDSFAHDFRDNGVFGTANRLAVVGNTIHRLDALETGGHAVRIAGGRKSYISHNTITDNEVFTVLTIRGRGIYTSNTEAVVTDNLFDDVISFSPQIFAVPEYISNVLAERNRFVPPPGASTLLESIHFHATNVVLRNNLFYNFRTPIKPFFHYTLGDPLSVTIVGNTHYIDESARIEHAFVKGNITDGQIKNNIMVSLSSATFNRFSTGAFTQTVQSNNIAYFPNHPPSCLDVQGTTGTNCTDPQLLSTDPASADFLKIAPGSPAVDTAAPAPLYDDYERRPRPQGAGMDLGAHEIGPATTNRAPIVGPIVAGAADTDPATAGIQIAEGTPVRITGVAVDPDGDPFSWQWLMSADGGSQVPFAAGTNAPIVVRGAAFIYPYGTQSSVMLTLRVNDAAHVEESTLLLHKAGTTSNAQATVPIAAAMQTTHQSTASATSPVPSTAVVAPDMPAPPPEPPVPMSDALSVETSTTTETSRPSTPAAVAGAPDPHLRQASTRQVARLRRVLGSAFDALERRNRGGSSLSSRRFPQPSALWRASRNGPMFSQSRSNLPNPRTLTLKTRQAQIRSFLAPIGVDGVSLEGFLR